MQPPDPSFTQPWHAQVFALTVLLNETGRLHWPDWAAAFGATLKQHGLSRELDGGDDYFAAWLETLEQVIIGLGMGDAQSLSALKSAWEDAYLTTPHGAPVSLAD